MYIVRTLFFLVAHSWIRVLWTMNHIVEMIANETQRFMWWFFRYVYDIRRM